MIAPLQILLISGGNTGLDTSHLTEPLQRAGYEATIEKVDTVEQLSVALASRRWDAVLVNDPPENLSAIDLLAWIERCRTSTPLVVLADDPDACATLKEMGVSEVLHRTQAHQLGLVLSRARRAASVPEGTSFRSFASRAPIAFHRTGIDGRVLYANAALANLLGADSPDEVVGRHMQYEFGFPRDAFLSEMSSTGEVNDLLVSWRKANGEATVVRETAWAQRDPAGSVVSYEGMIEVMPLPEVSSNDGATTFRQDASPEAPPKPKERAQYSSNSNFAWAAPARTPTTQKPEANTETSEAPDDSEIPQLQEDAAASKPPESVMPSPAPPVDDETFSPPSPVDDEALFRSSPAPDEETEFAVSDEEPEFAVSAEESEFSVGDDEPEFAVSAEESEFSVGDEEPEFAVGDEEPEFAVSDEEPEFAVSDEEPEFAFSDEGTVSEPEASFPDDEPYEAIVQPEFPESGGRPLLDELVDMSFTHEVEAPVDEPPVVEAEAPEPASELSVPVEPEVYDEVIPNEEPEVNLGATVAGSPQEDVPPGEEEWITPQQYQVSTPAAASSTPETEESFAENSRRFMTETEFDSSPPPPASTAPEPRSVEEPPRADSPREVRPAYRGEELVKPTRAETPPVPPVQPSPPQAPAPEAQPPANISEAASERRVDKAPEADRGYREGMMGRTLESGMPDAKAARRPVSPPPEHSAPPVPQPVERPAPTAAAKPPPEPEDQRLRMLVVEDNMDTRQLLQRVLKPHYHVDMAADAGSAVEQMSRRRYDVLLMDIHLGGKETGADVLRVARELPGYDTVTAIAVTAYALPGDRDSLLNAGFDGYVSKPFTVQALLSSLQEAGAKIAEHA